ncbi:hypothetical protein [Streptococcus pneumoniae]|uniref:hypothetical protein n=1 Tax=Streptococcus pneumoniae TaxID=1313 RepID=UPI000B5903EE|nr:hypothetical protein [Streptococcus pneumoniae]
MKREQDKLIRTVKSISNNVLEVDVYYSSFNLLYLKSAVKSTGESMIVILFQNLINHVSLALQSVSY